MLTNEAPAPDVLLLIGPGCPHCPAVLEGFGELVKQGAIGRLEVVNVAQRPEIAQRLGTRSVPWMRIGSFELTGAQTLGELRRWAELAVGDSGTAAYYSHLLESGELNKALEFIRQQPESLRHLVQLLADAEAPIAVRIGVSVVMEDFQRSPWLEAVIPELEPLTRAQAPYTRADACYYLGLTGSREVIPSIERLLDDANAEVREIAQEALEMLIREQ